MTHQPLSAPCSIVSPKSGEMRPPVSIADFGKVADSMNSIVSFTPPLVEGLIRRRRNRFIFEVECDGASWDCHCPSTGGIGGIVLQNIPCLMSKSDDAARKTRFTAEAISLDLLSTPTKRWVGINQNKANRYVENLIRSGQLAEMVGHPEQVLREKTLGNSKFDFLVGQNYIEVKTPLNNIQVDVGEHISRKAAPAVRSVDRFVRHISGLADSLGTHEKAILITFFMYDNPGYRPGTKHRQSKDVRAAVASAVQSGVEIWQVNASIDAQEVRLIRYFEATSQYI